MNLSLPPEVVDALDTMGTPIVRELGKRLRAAGVTGRVSILPEYDDGFRLRPFSTDDRVASICEQFENELNASTYPSDLYYVADRHVVISAIAIAAFNKRSATVRHR